MRSLGASRIDAVKVAWPNNPAPSPVSNVPTRNITEPAPSEDRIIATNPGMPIAAPAAAVVSGDPPALNVGDARPKPKSVPVAKRAVSFVVRPRKIQAPVRRRAPAKHPPSQIQTFQAQSQQEAAAYSAGQEGRSWRLQTVPGPARPPSDAHARGCGLLASTWQIGSMPRSQRPSPGSPESNVGRIILKKRALYQPADDHPAQQHHIHQADDFGLVFFVDKISGKRQTNGLDHVHTGAHKKERKGCG
jgi:hypothetical protein